MASVITIRRVGKALLILLGISLVLLLVGLLPASIEGNYRGIASGFSSDSFTFMRFSEERVVTYHVPNAVASLNGRYQSEADGSVSVFLDRIKASEGEQLVMRAYPKVFLTKFVELDRGTVWWCLKWPTFGDAAGAIRNYEITAMRIDPEGSITRQIYDAQFQEVRREIKIGPNQWAEQE
jgi:hypothetical protein